MAKFSLSVINNSTVLETPEKEFVKQRGDESRSELSTGHMRVIIEDNFSPQKFKQFVHHFWVCQILSNNESFCIGWMNEVS